MTTLAALMPQHVFRSGMRLSCLILFLALPLVAVAQPHEGGITPAPARSHGDGPFERLVLRGATLVDGTGAPARGPVDIVVENDRIVEIRSVGSPLYIDEDRRPSGATRELDLSGMYILPGFVDMHAHTGGDGQGVPAEYIYKLWMGHGITTVRENASGNGIEWTLAARGRAAENAITAPRMEAFVVFGMGWDQPPTTPDEAREWVRFVADRGADGVKFFGAPPAVLKAALEEARRQDLRTSMHHAQLGVTRADALDTATWGLTTMEHWYGLPEALFDDRTVQHYPADYNYNDERDRFTEAGRLWKQAAEPYSEHWNAVMDSLLALDFTIVPTFNIYEASRDFMRARNADWHATYTLPSLWEYYRPNPTSHGSYFFDWTTGNEVDWKRNYELWMTFVDTYKNRGGRVCAGSDSGFIYQLYGFGYVRELELLREAGFHPLEVVRAATLCGAEALGIDGETGSVEVGKKADFVVVEENPLANLKVLYGTGAIRLDEETGAVERVGGVRYTIKDGIIYDAAALRADVRRMVRAAKDEAGLPQGTMPVVPPENGGR